MTQCCKIFIRAICFKRSHFSPVCNWMIILWGLHFHWHHFLIIQFLNLTDNYEMWIRILDFFLNRNIGIIMDCCYRFTSCLFSSKISFFSNLSTRYTICTLVESIVGCKLFKKKTIYFTVDTVRIGFGVPNNQALLIELYLN